MYNINDTTIDKISQLLSSKQFFRYKGPEKFSECDLFEQQFSEFIGPKKQQFSIILNSGTNALINALKSLGISHGDEVLIPVNTFVATALAVVEVGAIPILVNIDQSFTINTTELEQKITAQTKAIIPVHLDGLACDMDKICEIAQIHNLHIIEDVAQAIGGEFKGQKLGTFGIFGCYSLNVDKIISTGEGGILTTNDYELYKKAFYIHDPAAKYGPTKKEMLKDTTANSRGFMRVSEIQGLLGQQQLQELPKILKQLRSNKLELINELRTNISNKLSIPCGHDIKGDCGTTLHLTLNKTEEMIELSKSLFKAGFTTMPMPTRLAHYGWQWKDILPYKFKLPLFLETLDLSARTIRISIEYHWTKEDKIKITSHLVDALKKLGY